MTLNWVHTKDTYEIYDLFFRFSIERLGKSWLLFKSRFDRPSRVN